MAPSWSSRSWDGSGVLNAVLAGFNLLPGAPLDGGRLLHAAVWRRSGDRSQATIVATRAGGRVGYTLIGIGVLFMLLGDISAVWFILLGWFLLAASRAEATHEMLYAAIADVRARDVMTGTSDRGSRRRVVDRPRRRLVPGVTTARRSRSSRRAATVTGLVTLAGVEVGPSASLGGAERRRRR